jgi:hypothetical protein
LGANIQIGLSAMVVAVRGGEALVLTVQTPEGAAGLPSGPFDPANDRTFELALRAFVTAQTGYSLGYVEQLYTFGDKGRDAPLADLGPARDGAPDDRVISIGYLALSPGGGDLADPPEALRAEWAPWTRFFPWEDWREGRPEVIDAVIAPALARWAGAADAVTASERRSRCTVFFALEGARWDEERVLERYELLYEAGLVPEAARDRRRTGEGVAPPPLPAAAIGQSMVSDHRRILATGLGRLRGKLKYRPVIFELTSANFTLLQLQKAVEAISGLLLHKQNFRRALERTGLVEGLGRFDVETGGRPAELFRFRRELLSSRPAEGLALPTLRDW